MDGYFVHFSICGYIRPIITFNRPDEWIPSLSLHGQCSRDGCVCISDQPSCADRAISILTVWIRDFVNRLLIQSRPRTQERSQLTRVSRKRQTVDNSENMYFTSISELHFHGHFFKIHFWDNCKQKKRHMRVRGTRE